MPARSKDPDDDRYLTRREVQAILEKDQERFLGRREAEDWRRAVYEHAANSWEGHKRQHAEEMRATELQLAHTEATRAEHEEAHNRDHVAHEKIHSQEQTAVDKALLATTALADSHDKAHDREHASAQLAIDKADLAADRRFSTSGADVETLRNEMDRRFGEVLSHSDMRYEENRKRIEVVEKGDSVQSGKGVGIGMAWAVVLGAIGAIGGALAIVFTIARFWGGDS